MAEKVTIMVLKVNLQCLSCYKKVKKIFSKFPQIRKQVYDDKANTVTITVVCCNPEKMRDKLCCKGANVIKSIQIKEPPKPSEPKKPEIPKKPEKPPVVVVDKPENTPDPIPPPAPAYPCPWPYPLWFPGSTCCGGYGGRPCYHGGYGYPPPPCYCGCGGYGPICDYWYQENPPYCSIM